MTEYKLVWFSCSYCTWDFMCCVSPHVGMCSMAGSTITAARLSALQRFKHHWGSMWWIWEVRWERGRRSSKQGNPVNALQSNLTWIDLLHPGKHSDTLNQNSNLKSSHLEHEMELLLDPLIETWTDQGRIHSQSFGAPESRCVRQAWRPRSRSWRMEAQARYGELDQMDEGTLQSVGSVRTMAKDLVVVVV